MSFGSAGFGWMAFLRLCVRASRLRHGHRHTAFTDEFRVTWWQQPPSPHSVVSHPTSEEKVSSSSVTCTCANGRASVWAFQPRTTSMSAPLQPLRRHTGNRMAAFIWCGQIIFKSLKQQLIHFSSLSWKHRVTLLSFVFVLPLCDCSKSWNVAGSRATHATLLVPLCHLKWPLNLPYVPS